MLLWHMNTGVYRGLSGSHCARLLSFHLTFWELVASIHREVYTATIYIHAILHRTTKNAAYVATAKMKVASSVEENII
jgi:hypothetical protein